MATKSSLLIVGAGGLGREVLAWAHEISPENRPWEVKGFLNSIPSALNGYDTGFSILGDALDYGFSDGELIICAIGDPEGKLNLCRKLVQQGAHFTSIIHSCAQVSSSAQISPGCIIATDSIVSPGAIIASFVTILGSTFIGVDAILEEGVTISGFCSVGAGAVIGEGAFLGSHAIVAPGTVIGVGARIGARTCVSGNIPAGSTFFGIPGRMIAGF